jgi:hypothetical protein
MLVLTMLATTLVDNTAEQSWRRVNLSSSCLPSNSHICTGHGMILDGYIAQGALMLSKYATPDSQIEEAPGDVQYLAVGAAGALLRFVSCCCEWLFAAVSDTSQNTYFSLSSLLGGLVREVRSTSTGVSAGWSADLTAGVLAGASAYLVHRLT